MSAFSTLLALINAQIKTNGLKAITGAKLNGVLVQMVNELGSGYQFIDIATPATDPGTPDENVWYIASQAGTYTNFGGIIVNENEVCALVWNGSWTKKVTGAATAAQVSQLGQIKGVLSGPSSYVGTPTANEIWIANKAGTYIYFLDSNSDPIVVNDGEVALLFYDIDNAYWRKDSITITVLKAMLSDSLKKEIDLSTYKTGSNESVIGIRTLTDFVWEAGLVKVSDGTLEGAGLNHITIDVSDVLIVDMLAFGSDIYGVAFYDSNGTFIAGASARPSLNDSKRRILQVPYNAATMKYTYYTDAQAAQNNVPPFDYITLWYKSGLYAGLKDVSGKESIFNPIQYRGAVAKANGSILNGDDNSYSKIWLHNASKINVRVFQSSNYGGAFFSSSGTYISGFSAPTVQSEHERQTFDVPVNAAYMLYSYLSDAYCEANDLPKMDYIGIEYARDPKTNILNLEDRVYALETSTGASKRPRPSTGAESFSVKVNGYLAQLDTDAAIGDTIVEITDWGIIWLPTNYTQSGTPVPLAIVCHGAGATYDHYRYCQLDTGGRYLYDPAKYLVQKGYAVMDMFGNPYELMGGSDLHLGNPITLLCYKAGYDYVVKNYNVESNAVFVSGSSMGGLSSFQIVQSGLFPVKAHAGYAPCVDLFKQAYCDAWSPQNRNIIATYFAFTGTAPTFTGTSYPTQDEITYFYNNLDKIVGFNPISRMLVEGDYSDTFTAIPADLNTDYDADEAAVYAQFRAVHPCPLKIWHCKNDHTVCYRYSEYIVGMLKKAGQMAFLRPFEDGGHSAWDCGDTVNDVDIDGNAITCKVSQREGYLWFERFR